VPRDEVGFPESFSLIPPSRLYEPTKQMQDLIFIATSEARRESQSRCLASSQCYHHNATIRSMFQKQ